MSSAGSKICAVWCEIIFFYMERYSSFDTCTKYIKLLFAHSAVNTKAPFNIGSNKIVKINESPWFHEFVTLTELPLLLLRIVLLVFTTNRTSMFIGSASNPILPDYTEYLGSAPNCNTYIIAKLFSMLHYRDGLPPSGTDEWRIL